MRTGGVFHGLAYYLARTNVEIFQWENVLTLANKAVDKKSKKEVGPSNLSSVCHILRTVSGMWTHVYRLDSQLFGSGQGRGRLWGSSFKLSSLKMDEQNAHKLLDELMSFFVGVEGTDPEDFLHPQSHPEVQCSLSKGTFMGQSREDFLIENENGEEGENADCRLSFEALFKSNGALPPDQGRSRKRQKTSAAAPAWIGKHEEAFAKLGEDIESQT